MVELLVEQIHMPVHNEVLQTAATPPLKMNQKTTTLELQNYIFIHNILLLMGAV